MPNQMTAEERAKVLIQPDTLKVFLDSDKIDEWVERVAQAIREAEEATYNECKDYFRHDHGCSADIDERYDLKIKKWIPSKYPCRCGLTEFRKRFAERGRDGHILP